MKEAKPPPEPSPFDPNRRIGTFLTYLRRDAGFTSQTDFAAKLQISRNYLANIEAGRTPIKLGTAWRACQLLNIHPGHLIAWGTNLRGPFPELTPDLAARAAALVQAVGQADFIDSWAAVCDVLFPPGPPAPAQNIPTEEKKELQKVSDSGNVSEVKLEYPNLLKRLERTTSKRGKKTELAKFLGVSLIQVSQWLSGDRMPGGETTLRLLRWVEQEERKN